MAWLLIGATGLAGKAFADALRKRGIEHLGLARRDTEIELDISDSSALAAVLEKTDPEIVINCAAIVDIAKCDNEAEIGWAVNTTPASILADWSKKISRPILHISTDHYYNYGENSKHDESAPVFFANNYARQKFAAESFALTSPHALVLRTSIVGLRGWEQPTLAEWAIDAVLNDRQATLFADSFSSSIDVGTFADYALDLLLQGDTGLFNLAAGEVYTKEQFVLTIADQLGRKPSSFRRGSIATLCPRRAGNLGLDVTKAEKALQRRMPSLNEVVARVLDQRG